MKQGVPGMPKSKESLRCMHRRILRGVASPDRAANLQFKRESCAVDPKRIPYGSKVIFPDAACVAVDTGPDVVSRKVACSCGRQPAERKAIVIDRFFDSKQKALAWAKTHPHFMTVRILTPGIKEAGKLVASKDPRSSLTNIASSPTASWEGRPNHFH